MPPGEPSHPGRIQKAASFLLWLLKDQWFVLGLALVIVVASQVQVPASQQEVKATIISYLSPAVIFFVTGCTLSTRSLINNYARWKVNLFVQCHCFLVTSSLGFAVVYAVATNKQFMDPWLLIGLIISASLPTTIASNVVMTRQAKGNTALTVVQTTIGNSLVSYSCCEILNSHIHAGLFNLNHLSSAIPPVESNVTGNCTRFYVCQSRLNCTT